jgi:proteasome lid subunit RPN8/RPN11
MSVIHLPRSVYEALRTHAEQAYPEECCGALLGRVITSDSTDNWEITAAVHVVNADTASARTRYSIDPAELVGIVHEARRQGLEIAGFYHSHPNHPAHWSLTDLAEAHWLGCSYVITSVRHGRAADTSAFLLAGASEEDKHFEPQQICILEASAAEP